MVPASGIFQQFMDGKTPTFHSSLWDVFPEAKWVCQLVSYTDKNLVDLSARFEIIARLAMALILSPKVHIKYM